MTGYLMKVISIPFELLLNNNDSELLTIINFVFIISSLYFYYKSNTKSSELIFAIIATIFLNFFNMVIFEKYALDTKFYFWQYFIGVMITGVILIGISILKTKNSPN